MSGNKYEQDYFWNRVFGQWAWAAWIMLICNMVLPLSLWSQKLRRNPKLAVHPVAVHQPRHVVRAIRDRRAVAVARVRAVAVGHVPSHVGRLRHSARQLRLVLHVVPAVHQAAARDGDGRDQGSLVAAN
jgi:hypothetical protein